MKKYFTLLSIALVGISCSQKKSNQNNQGKVEREQISLVSKIPGRIEKLLVQEGQNVQKGDTLAILNIPEIQAKKAQAKGAVKSAKAQYQMTTHGATKNQMTQLLAKKIALTEQYEYAKKSLSRLDAMVKDSLIAQQKYDEIYAKYQGAQAQLNAVNAEIADVEHGIRIEQQTMALGQQDRALGALQEANIAEGERYIIAPQAMEIETITLKEGELALAGYTLFKGTLPESAYFRFTVSESELSKYPKNKEMTVEIPYAKKEVQAKIQRVKQIGAYANIATAYPDYDLQNPLYEVVLKPINSSELKNIYTKTTAVIKP